MLMVARSALALLAVALAVAGYFVHPSPDWALAPAATPNPDLAPRFKTVFRHAHAGAKTSSPSFVPGSADGSFAVLWSETQGANTRVVGVTFPERGAPTEVMTPETLSGLLSPAQTVSHIQSARDDGSGGLLVSTALRGAEPYLGVSAYAVAGSGGALQTGRRLSLSPFQGRVAAMEGASQPLKSGGLVLPVQTLGTAGRISLAYLDAAGRVRAIARLPEMSDAVSEARVSRNETDPAVVLKVSATPDPKADATTGPAFRGNVSSVRLSSGDLLSASTVGSDQGDLLLLSTSSRTGHAWQRRAAFGTAEGGAIADLALTVLGDGQIALAYTAEAHSELIVHVFTETWVLSQ